MSMSSFASAPSSVPVSDPQVGTVTGTATPDSSYWPSPSVSHLYRNWSVPELVHGRTPGVESDDVSGGDAGYRLEEWAYLDGAHVSQTFHLLSTEVGERELRLADGSPYRMKAGTVVARDDFVDVSLDGFFDARPVVLAQAQTFGGPDPIITRLRDVGGNSFEVRLQEEEALGEHTTETVGYVALQQAAGRLAGNPFEVRRTRRTVSDEWLRLTFRQEYENPRFVAAMQTFNGPDTAALRYRNLTGTGVEVKVKEEKSADAETNHTTEAVGYAVFEGDA